MDRKFPIHAAAVALTFSAVVFAAATFVPNDQPYGYQAAPAMSQSDVSDGNALAFVPWFQTEGFVGDLIAAPVRALGIVNMGAPRWRAADVLDTQDWDTGRRIFTVNDATGVAVPFRYANLSGGQQGAVVSEIVLNYIRGDRIFEGGLDGLPIRGSLLGDIIHSNPEFVGRPRRGYTFDAYSAFAEAQRNRAGRVYVGANDGMLHAFDAATGTEAFAFIPPSQVPRLTQRILFPDSHTYMVDGPLVAEDAWFGGAWHTVLVGGLGAGGRALYALDVTDAATGSEAAEAARFLWEFDDGDLNILGHTYSRPSVVRLNNDRWAAVIGNGYMGNKKAALVIIDLQTGTLIRSIEVADDDDNGLSSPALVDTDGDARVDAAYAGDLNGNLWKFDLSSPDPADWAPAFGFLPMFKTEYDPDLGERQPITTAPTVGYHPKGGLFVYIATGRLLDKADAADKAGVSPQSAYGIRDNQLAIDQVPVPLASLLAQTLRSHTHQETGEPVRTATFAEPDWGVHAGWRTRLDALGASPGARVITDPVLRAGRLQFVTIDPRDTAGENFLMQLNAITGGAPTRTVMDVNHDGDIDLDDNVDGNGNGMIEDLPADRVVGRYEGFGTVSAPRLVSVGDGYDAAIVNHLYTITASDSPSDENIPPEGEDAGLLGGHMDLDTASAIYDFNDGTTDNHVHEWDDKYNSTVVDFFGILGDGFTDIDALTRPPAFGNRKFIITVANAHLSPGAVIEINGVGTPVREYRARMKRFLNGNLGLAESFPVYKLGPLSDAEQAAGLVELTSFKLAFAKNAIAKGGLHPTNTGCVRNNEPGQNGEYRNGALTVQALDATDLSGGYAFNVVTDTHDATSNAIHRLGYAYARNALDMSLFWEATAFWHWGGPCYGIADALDYAQDFLLEVGKEDDRGTDDDISGDPLPPETPPDADDDDDTTTDPADPATSTTKLLGQPAGRMSWRELLFEE